MHTQPGAFLITNVQHTALSIIHRLLNGDSKTEVLPLFRVTMVLEKSARVELRPTIQQLFDTVHKVGAPGWGWELGLPGQTLVPR